MSDDVYREILLRRLHAVFPDARAVEEAINSLDRIGENEVGASRSIVQLAVLKLCQGELWRLRELVQNARKDFRDVLYPAQAPERMAALNSGRQFPGVEEAMTKRDQAQWIQWITSE